jgi:cytochrome P450
MAQGEQNVTTSVNNPVPAGFDALPVLDLRDPNFTVEGNRILAELRAKGPVCRVEPLGALGFLRWADCDAILRDFRTFSAAFAHSMPVPGAEEETKIDTLLREDPPKHTRVRTLMQQAFTPQRVAAMEPHTRDITRKLIDGIMAGGNECDFLNQFTLPLPSTVMSGLLGVDSSMMETFARWANSMMGANTAHAIKDEAARQKRYQEIARDAKDMEVFLAERIEETPTRSDHLSHPGHGGRRPADGKRSADPDEALHHRRQ